MKLKKGFTLAEVLIALAIVGVVASMTIPQFVNSAQKVQAGPKLAKAIKQVELGVQNLLQIETEKKSDGTVITRISAIDDFSINKLAPYIGVTPTDNTSVFSGKSYDYIWNDDLENLKIESIRETVANSGDSDPVIANFIIDTNGTQKPNTLGRDRFALRITDCGEVLPAAGNPDDCPDVGESCTAKVMQDGYKVKY